MPTVQQVSGCHLQAISGVDGAFSMPSSAKTFDELCKQGHGKGDGYRGQYITGTIVSVTVGHPCSNAEETLAGLKKRGFKLLGIQDGAHGSYKMHLYGLGFTLPKEKK